MIKTEAAKILLKIAAVSVVVTMAVYGTGFSSGADDSPANRTANPFSSHTIYVPDDYETIQEAVDNASSGDMIIVRDGTYNENVDVNKSLTIQSENGSTNCIVNASDPNDHVFNVTADYVNISGFTVEGATGEWWENAGIHLNSVNNSTITDNIALKNNDGIFLMRSSNNIILNNTCLNNWWGIILVSSSNDNNLTNNNCSNNSEGIMLFYSDNKILMNNNCSSNNLHDIHFLCSSNNILRSNTMGFFYVDGPPECYSHDIDTSNLINGKPTYYLVNQDNVVLDGLTEAGFVGVVSSTNITIKDLTLTNNRQGVLFVSTTHSKLENLNLTENEDGILLLSSSNNTVTNNNASNNGYGVYLSSSSNNTIANNTANSNAQSGFHLINSPTNSIVNNTANSNSKEGIQLSYSSNNTITNNIANSNGYDGIYLSESSNTSIAGNTANENNHDGIWLSYSSNNIIMKNTASSNEWNGINLMRSSNNTIYQNNFINNTYNGSSFDSINIWNSTESLLYHYNGSEYTNYLGNYWDDYTGSDVDCDGIGDTSYVIPYDNNDNYPLMKPWENYSDETEDIEIVSFDTDKEVYNAKEEINFFLSIYAPRNISEALIEVKGVKSRKGVYYVSYSNLTDLVIGLNNISVIKKLPSCLKCAGLGAGTYFITASVTYDTEVVTATHSIVLIKHIFDTGSPTTPYPSIAGTHNGTITPSSNLTVFMLYTYPCLGTGGHTEYVAFYNVTTGEEIANGTWKGYKGLGDYHYLEFKSPFVLRKNETYNYTIRTSSYPQIHHNRTLLTANGWINCTEFTDVNGKTSNSWIPAIRLE